MEKARQYTSINLLKSSIYLFFVLPFASAAHATSIPVPSGQDVMLYEVIADTAAGHNWLRFRFIAPQIGTQADAITYKDASADFEHLCAHIALPYLKEASLIPDFIVISLGDRPVPFGQAAPDATQFFEAFRPLDNRCIWEAF